MRAGFGIFADVEAALVVCSRRSRVLAVYTRPRNPERVLVCLDETAKHIAETRLRIPMKPGQAARIDYEYERNGTANGAM